jgi:hypothetical protein
MDKQLIAEDINRAELARQITTNPVYIQSMQMIQAKAFNDFTESDADDEVGRKHSWLQMQSHKEFTNVLEELMEKGLFAEDAKSILNADDNFIDKDLY